MDKPLADLIRISNAVGKDKALVQGGGGNASVKTADGKYMYIKASGTALKDMNARQGWRRMRLEPGQATVERIRKRFVMDGFESALSRKNRTNYQRKIDGKANAHLIALACSKAPEGYDRWTLRLLADKLVELKIVDSCSKDTIHRTQGAF